MARKPRADSRDVSAEKRAVAARFHRSVNMTPAEIRAWARDPRAKCASFASTRARLPALARLKAKPVSAWTAADVAYAARVVNFNTRMQGNVDAHGCRTRNVTSLLNWGRRPPRCKMPPAGCSARPPRTKPPRRGPGD